MKLQDDKVYSRLGTDYLRLHDLPKAVEAMAHANDINPADLENSRNLGIAYMQMGRKDDAERTFRAITAQNDRYAPAYDGLGLLALQREDIETARREFEKALQVDPKEVVALLNLGMLYQKTGNQERALYYFQSFLTKAPPRQFGNEFPAVRAAIQELEGEKK
jgi:tetratricopeptide (TPR) repeat protein